MSLGTIGSGLDIASLVSRLVASERAPRENQINTAGTAATAKVSALGTIKSGMTSLQSALSTLVRNVATPGLKTRGQGTPRIVETLDLYPTITDYCGLTAPGDLAGTSLRPLLQHPKAEWNRPAYTQVRRGATNNFFMGYSVRTERWRYTEWDGGKKGVELYDHDKDPREFTNRAGDPQCAQVVAEMKALFKRDLPGRAELSRPQ